MEQPELGLKLRELRESIKLSRKAFSDATGLTQARIANIELGKKLKDGDLDAITKAFPSFNQVVFLPDQPTRELTEEERHPPHGGWIAPTDYIGVDEPADENAPAELMDRDAVIDKLSDALDIPADLLRSSDERRGDITILQEELEDPDADEFAPLELDAAPVPATPAPETREAIEREPGTLLVSNSEVQTFKRCRRKWWLGWYRGLRVKHEDKTGARAIGDRVHRALKAFYVPSGETPQDPRDALERVITHDWTVLVMGYQEEGYSEPPPSVVDEFQSNTSLERAMVEGYLKWLEETGIDRGLRVVNSETYLEVDFPIPGHEDTPVKLIGKIDVRLIRESDGVRLFIDHKTVGSIGDASKMLPLDEQMLHYHLLEFLSDTESGRCDGALYNMLRKVKRTARANPPFYGRVEVRHNEYELESFKTRLVGTVKAMLDVRYMLDNGADFQKVAFPTPNKNCTWDCDFFKVCGMFDDGSRVDDALEAHYVVGDPLHYYQTEEE